MAASLEQLLADAIESQTRDLWTSLPARVTAWTGGTTPTVTVQPFPATYLDGEPVALPELGGVPVCYPGGAGGGIVYPLAAGDIVLLVFSSLPVGQYRNSGSEGDPGEIRHHDLSDAFAIPLRCAGVGPDAPADRILAVQPTGGKVQIGDALLHPAAARVGDSVATGVDLAVLVSIVPQIVTLIAWYAAATPGVPVPIVPLVDTDTIRTWLSGPAVFPPPAAPIAPTATSSGSITSGSNIVEVA